MGEEIEMDTKLQSQQCEFEGCQKPATSRAVGRGKKYTKTGALWLCDKHAASVLEYDNPEYCVECPGCGTSFGVN